VLGAVFIYSAWSKLGDPPGFAHVIWNYRILPSSVVNLMTLFIPWLELIAGAALISGIYRRGAAVIVAGMLAVFIAALTLNLVRGNPVDCGCFSLAVGSKSRDDIIRKMSLDILRDVGLLLLCIQAFVTPVTWRKPSD
jgi:uncharacterized membrane protein YphA (DoxX/SURF4 family)